jgi:hypothetical protein
MAAINTVVVVLATTILFTIAGGLVLFAGIVFLS